MQHTESTPSNTDIFTVTINPNVDHAFIASLVIILDVYNRIDKVFAHRVEVVHQAVHRAHPGLHAVTHFAIRAGACTIQ